MDCNNLIPQPSIGQCESSIFGIPFGQEGRSVGGVPIDIQGIVIHCTDEHIMSVCNEQKCRTSRSVISGSAENSYHFGVGGDGPMLQFVDPNNVAWSFGAYKGGSYTGWPPASVPINWPVIQAENPEGITPDAYTINIILARGTTASEFRCTVCPSASGLPENRHNEFIRLLARLVQEYDIPLDNDHLTFHNLITCAESYECDPCHDIDTIIDEIGEICYPCEGEEASNQYPAMTQDDTLLSLIGVIESCCPDQSAGCMVTVPFDGCVLGGLTEPGDIAADMFVGLDAEGCFITDNIDVLAPIVGQGIDADPFRLDPCLFGDWLSDEPIENIVNIVGVDVSGCLIESPIDSLLVPITPVDTNCIDLSVSGTLDHTLQADIVLSACADNLITCEDDGLCVQFDCNDLAGLFNAGTVVNLYGNDGAGACVMQDLVTAVTDIVDCDVIAPLFVPGVVANFYGDDGAGGCVSQTVADVINDNITCDMVAPLFVPSTIVNLYGDDGAGACVAQTAVDVITGIVDCDFIAPLFTPGVAVNLYGDDGAGNCVAQTVADVVEAAVDCDVIAPLFTPGVAVNLYGDNGAGACVAQSVTDVIAASVDCDVISPLFTAGTLVNLYGDNGVGGCVVEPLVDTISRVICDYPNRIAATPTWLLGTDDTECPIFVTTASIVAAGLGVADTATIDITLNNNIISAVTILDPAADNILQDTNGLYVPDITVSDGFCVHMNYNPATRNINSELIVSQLPDNIFQCLPGTPPNSGAYVPDLTVTDGNCVNLTYVGRNLTAEAIISGLTDNILTCEADGLYVPTAAGLTVLNPPTDSCVELTLSPEGVLSAALTISALDCNGLSCEADGLYVNNEILTVTSDYEGTSSTGEILSDGDWTTPVNPESQPFLIPVDNGGNPIGPECKDITNPSDCNPMMVTLSANSITWNFTNLTGTDDAIVEAGFQYSLNSDGGSHALNDVWTSQTLTRVGTPNNLFVSTGGNGLLNPGIFIAPGETITFCIQPIYRMRAGTFNGKYNIDSFTVILSGDNFIS